MLATVGGALVAAISIQHMTSNGLTPVCTPCMWNSLLFYVLAISKVMSGRVPTYDSAHSLGLYSAASLGHQATRTMTCYLTYSHYPDTQYVPYHSFPCPNNIEYQARKWQVSIFKSLVFIEPRFEPAGSVFEHVRFGFPDLPAQETNALLIQPPHPVW